MGVVDEDDDDDVVGHRRTLWVRHYGSVHPCKTVLFDPLSHLTYFYFTWFGQICEIGWWEVVLRQAVLWPKTDSI